MCAGKRESKEDREFREDKEIKEGKGKERKSPPRTREKKREKENTAG